MPIPHDFIVSNDKIITLDAPLLFDGKKLLNSSVPVYFDGQKTNYYTYLNMESGKHEEYHYNKGIYIFHYADIHEDDDFIHLFAPMYDNIDYSDLNLHGKYRKMIENKHTKEIGIFHNHQLEQYNLDFPVKMNDGRIVLRNLNGNRSDGFVVCDNLSITNTFFYEHRNICGEPAIIDIHNEPHIICFAYDNNENGYCLLINVNQNKTIEIDLQDKVTIGFHSVFM